MAAEVARRLGVAPWEERARSELGMIRHDEVFFQLPADAAAAPPALIKPQDRR